MDKNKKEQEIKEKMIQEKLGSFLNSLPDQKREIYEVAVTELVNKDNHLQLGFLDSDEFKLMVHLSGINELIVPRNKKAYERNNRFMERFFLMTKSKDAKLQNNITAMFTAQIMYNENNNITKLK